eukprot:5792685-Karenia_brevis.AAC.1
MGECKQMVEMFKIGQMLSQSDSQNSQATGGNDSLLKQEEMMKRLEDVAAKIQTQGSSGAQGSQSSGSLDPQPAAGVVSES